MHGWRGGRGPGGPGKSCRLIVTVRGGSRGQVELPGGGGIYAVYSQAAGVSRGVCIRLAFLSNEITCEETQSVCFVQIVP